MIQISVELFGHVKRCFPGYKQVSSAMVLFYSVSFHLNHHSLPSAVPRLVSLSEMGYSNWLIASNINQHIYIFPEEEPSKLKCFYYGGDKLQEVSLENDLERKKHLKNVLYGFLSENLVESNPTLEDMMENVQTQSQVYFVKLFHSNQLQ